MAVQISPTTQVGEGFHAPSLATRWLIGTALAFLSAFGGAVATYTTTTILTGVEIKASQAFQIEAKQQFKAMADDMATRFAAEVKARDDRIDALNLKLDQVAAGVGARFERVDRTFEQRGDRLGALENRVTALESKICYQAGIKCH